MVMFWHNNADNNAMMIRKNVLMWSKMLSQNGHINIIAFLSKFKSIPNVSGLATLDY